MKKIVKLLAVLLLSSMGIPQLVYAVSWSPIEEETAQGIMAKGTVVCLFESGTADVRNAITTGDTLIVYRENKFHEFKAVGKIKMLSYSGENYLKGEVLEGELRAGDIAKKGDVASLIISPGKSCK